MENLEDTTIARLQSNVPHTALQFLCPVCERTLEYVGSRASSDSDALDDINDYFRCPVGCGTFEHERRRHRLRMV
jgi:hypothetical protein